MTKAQNMAKEQHMTKARKTSKRLSPADLNWAFCKLVGIGGLTIMEDQGELKPWGLTFGPSNQDE
jgi:hypothetical protein